MAYIGKQPVVGNFVKLDTITTSATATYNLLNGGVAYYPQSANNCIVSLNGVIQSPTSAYTISGSTIVFSDALTSSDTIDFILVLGDVLNIGTPSDGTVTSAKLASGVSGLISWQSVQTSGFTAVAGRGYPCNTTSSAFTVTLPATPTAGDQIILLDYAGTFDTNALTINPNGNKIEGATSNLRLTGEREGILLVYIDSTQGWLATSGINEGTDALSPPTYSVDFLVIAGGGGGGVYGGAGGAGGYRNSYSTETSGGNSSSEASAAFNPGTVYTVTVGAGGAGVAIRTAAGNSGTNSSITGTGFTTITSTGGGGGASDGNPGSTGIATTGGSGGGGAYVGAPNGGAGGSSGASGTANQGFAGGNGGGSANYGCGGGGGAGGAGGNGSGTTGGTGGVGLSSSITGSSVARGGGGGGGHQGGNDGTATDGGGRGESGQNGINGTVNTGGGGGGTDAPYTGGSGGKGVVILRMPDANYSGTTTGSPTVNTNVGGTGETVIIFNDSGSITG